MTAVRLSVLLCLVSVLLEVQSQTFPFVRAFGTFLLNHSYIDFNEVGGIVETSVQCRTDLDTCCREDLNGPHRGDWYFPSGERLPTEVSDIYEAERSSNVQVRRLNNATTAGIYRCEIETGAANGDSRGIVYAGLYTSGGDVIIPDTILLNVDSDLSGESPQFTLNVISTGGPATTVTWTRDSEEVSGGMTVLDDPVTAQYTHTLTVTGRLPGAYQCTVFNNKPSTDRRSIPVRVGSPPTNLMAVQEGPTDIRVSWTPPSDARFTRGYRIYYSGGSSGSVDVSDSDTSNHLLTDLVNEASYTISIVGTSAHFPSERVHYMNSITLIALPEKLSTMVSSITATSIFVSWRASSFPAVDSYQVEWERVSSGDCLAEHGITTIIGDSTSYNIVGLEEGSSYMVTLRATNKAGNTVSDPVTGVTGEIVPSGPPTSVSISDVTTSSITVQWRAVDCIHRNGDITGYIVQYGVQGNGCTERRNVSGGTTTEAMIIGLMNDTTYYIEVAAVNGAGIGEYSNRTTAMTESGSKQSDKGSDCDEKIGGCAVGGFVGGVLITAVVGAILHFLFVQRIRTRLEMRNSLSNGGKQQKGGIPTSTNQAYGFVTSEVRDIDHEMRGTLPGAATANEDSTYESVPI